MDYKRGNFVDIYISGKVLDIWILSVRVSREKRGNFAARLNRHDSRASRYTSFISPFNLVSLSLFSVSLTPYTETFER